VTRPDDAGLAEPAQHGEQLPVFVYGTLRVGELNHRRLVAGRTTREIPAVMPNQKMYAGAYPCVADDPEGGEIVGDLLFIRPELYAQMLAELDELEEYRPEEEDPWYRRVSREARYRDEEGRTRTVEAWVYHGGRATLSAFTERDRVADGDWLAYCRRTGHVAPDRWS
jgi:gamma-glutamylcyclotransferase (GGCT)/AIG2-like uncharacterized protein YtfP